MSSLKPVKSLFDLSLCATRDLVISAAINIEKVYPSASGLSYDVPGCSEAVRPMQGMLHDQLPVTVYEALFQAVCEKVSDYYQDTGIADKRIVFSTFICAEVKLKKLVLNYQDMTNFDSDTWQWNDDPIQILKNQRHVEFWLNQLPMLANLTELNLQLVSNHDLILAFIRTCTKLEQVRLPSIDVSAETLGPVLQSIPALTKLHKFVCLIDRASVEEIMTTFDVDKKWTIRNLCLENPTSQECNLLINLCPQLVDLCITGSEEHDEVLQVLASCPQKFHKLSFDIYNDTVAASGNLFACKGIHIRELKIFCDASVNPLKILLLISETCPNLTSLFVRSSLLPQNRATFHDVISFPKLERLVVSKWPSSTTSGLIAVAKHCLANAPKLISLKFDRWTSDEEGDAEEMIQLFTSNRLIKQLTDVHITCFKELISTNLSRKIIDSCKNLKSFKLRGVNADARLYLSSVTEEIKRKNLDINLEFS